MPDYQPRHTWHPTGLGMPQDFCCHVGGRAVGRIYLANSFREESWYWSMFAHGPGIDRQGRMLCGYMSTPREAARRVEEAWDRVAPKHSARRLSAAPSGFG